MFFTHPPAPESDESWITLDRPSHAPPAIPTPVHAQEAIANRIVRIDADLASLQAFYKIEGSATRNDRLGAFYEAELAALEEQDFDTYDQEARADYLLLQNYLRRALRTLELDAARDAAYAPFVRPFADPLIAWVEARMRVDAIEPEAVAASFDKLVGTIRECRQTVEEAPQGRYAPATGYRAARAVEQLSYHVREMYDFYHRYDPLFDWWVRAPFKALDAALAALPAFFREALAGVAPGDADAIVGEPIGRAGLEAELQAEMIPYTPEELLRIAETEYWWCEGEMVKASRELGFGDTWREALEHVKGLVEPPGAQPRFIKALVDEGAAYVQAAGLVTVPRIAEEAMRMYMIPPAQQKVSPFFLGGTYLQVSYPTAAMAHGDKMMSMRGNNRHFARATAFHEMIPGHHLQLFVADRVRPYRRLFGTPFYIEGWALYWELLLWTRGDFFTSAADRVGTLFWRMHRCVRIVFSLRFHLGELTPAECIDMLVDRVGHERATAEGEVRRSFNGDYSPLYQAGYLLGALQLWRLRDEAVDQGHWPEKEFHDAILNANMMPIEILRALLLKQPLSNDFKTSWRFYGDV